LTTSYEKIFIETSTIVDYALKSEYKEIISNILSQYEVKLSSNYVRMELKRGVIQYLVYLHNKIIRCRDWPEVMRAISSLSPTLQRHRLGTILEVMHQFFASLENESSTEDISINDYLKKDVQVF
jgi:hypothetical protein